MLKFKFVASFYLREKDLPISCCFGQFVLRLPVMRVQPEHEAASAQLGLRLLQLLRQVKHLACGVVRVLTIQQTHTETHSCTICRQKLDKRFSTKKKNFCRMATNLSNKP